MEVQRVNYMIRTNSPKKNGQKPSYEDVLKIGYMAGRYGISLDGNLQANHKPQQTQDGVKINVNSCTTSLLETNLNKMGIKFDRIA